MENFEKVKKSYQDKFKKFGINSRSLAWKGPGASDQRFRQFWAEIDFSGKKILDVGCGFGRLAKFLDKRYQNFSYTGIDVVPEFIEVAKKRYPEHRFFVCDYFNQPLPEKFDVIVASGVLNFNFPDN